MQCEKSKNQLEDRERKTSRLGIDHGGFAGRKTVDGDAENLRRVERAQPLKPRLHFVGCGNDEDDASVHRLGHHVRRDGDLETEAGVTCLLGQGDVCRND